MVIFLKEVLVTRNRPAARKKNAVMPKRLPGKGTRCRQILNTGLIRKAVKGDGFRSIRVTGKNIAERILKSLSVTVYFNQSGIGGPGQKRRIGRWIHP